MIVRGMEGPMMGRVGPAQKTPSVAVSATASLRTGLALRLAGPDDAVAIGWLVRRHAALHVPCDAPGDTGVSPVRFRRNRAMGDLRLVLLVKTRQWGERLANAVAGAGRFSFTGYMT